MLSLVILWLALSLSVVVDFFRSCVCFFVSDREFVFAVRRNIYMFVCVVVVAGLLFFFP